MFLAFGLALILLTLYASILSYGLRVYSRTKLSEHLPEERQRVWLDRLDRYDAEFQVLTSFFRLSFIIAVVVWVYFGYHRESSPQLPWPGSLLPPLLTFLGLLIFAVGIPNAIATHAGEAWLARSLGLLWVLRHVFYPVERSLMALDFIVKRLVGKPDRDPEAQSERVEQEILEAVTEGELHGAVDEGQKAMIESILALHQTAVSEIMTPRTDIVAIPVTATYEESRLTIVEAGHSRIPVFEQSIDHIIGVLYAKDLLRLDPGDDFNLRSVMRAAPYVPETKTIDELLDEFRQTKVQIAIVLDEYGGTAGLATIEDILEELVGEIDDEYDQQQAPPMNRVDDRTLEVDARVHVSEINAELGIELPEDADYDTIGGFVFATLGKIPTHGEEFEFENLHFQIVDAEPRKINRVRIRLSNEEQASSVHAG